MLRNEESIGSNLTKGFNRKNYRFLACYEEVNNLNELFGLIVEPNDKYIEICWDFVDGIGVYQELFTLLFKKFKGFNSDMVFNPTDNDLVEIPRKVHFKIYPADCRMICDKVLEYEHVFNIVKYSERYRTGYLRMHSRYRY